MLIKVPKNWKDIGVSYHAPHKPISRRELIQRGFATGAMAVAMNQFAFGSLLRQARADGVTCPTPTRNAGSVAQIFAQGGTAVFARFIGDAQAGMMNAAIANNYGISGQANLRKLGTNLNIDITSPFGFTLLQGPQGYPGGSTAWQANVLSKISGGGHMGPFSADDGAGQDTGLLGGVSPFKSSQMGKDLKIGVNNTLAAWANGLPSSSVSLSGLTPASLAKVFSLTPAAAGFTNSAALTAASQTSSEIANALAPVMKLPTRRGADQMATNTSCAFFGNAALADPNYGSTLFDPKNISALSGIAAAGITAQEQALLAGFYQSAAGVAGSVTVQFGNRDYHNTSPATTITPDDVEEARAVVMWLAACDAAQAKGSMMYFTNGSAASSTVQSVTTTIGGQSATVNAPVAVRDAGTSYNAGLIIFYDPKGAPPVAKMTGTVNSSSGNTTTDPNVANSKEAVAGLYLSALSWIAGGSPPATAVAKMQASGVAATPSKAMVI